MNMRARLLQLLWTVITFCVALGQPHTASAQGAAPSSPSSDARVRAAFHDVLSSPEYRYAPPQPSFIERQWKRFTDKLSDIWEWLKRHFTPHRSDTKLSGALAILPTIIYILLAVGLLVLIGYGAAALAQWIVQRRTAGPSRRKKAKVEDVVIEPEESAQTEPDAWIRAAQAYLAAGELRKAYRAVFIAVLVRLDHIGAIRFERSKTNGEYVRSLMSRPPLLALVRPVARDFDARWYGGLQISEDDYHRALRAYEDVRAQQA